MADDRTGKDTDKDAATKSIPTNNSHTTSIPNNLEEENEDDSSHSCASTTSDGASRPSACWKRDELQGDFQTWWSEARQFEEPPTAFDFLVKMGLNEKLVQKILWESLVEQCPLDPEKGRDHYTDRPYSDYNWKDCNEDKNEEDWYYRRSLIDPGVVDYFCLRLFGHGDEMPSMRHAPAGLPIFWSYADLVEAAFVSGGQRLDRSGFGPNEQDLRSLTDLAARAEEVSEHCMRNDDDVASCERRLDVKHAAVRQCMRYKAHPAKLLHDIIDQLWFGDDFRSNLMLGSPAGANDGGNRRWQRQQRPLTTIRKAIDHDCLLGILQMMKEGMELLYLEEHCWTESSFRELLHLLPQTQYLEKVRLTVPAQYVEDPKMPYKGADFVPQMELDCDDGDSHECNIYYLTLNFGSIFSNSQLFDPGATDFPGAHYAIQSIFSMPNLQMLELNLSAWPLANAAPYLVRAIEEKTTLKRLFITVDNHDTDSDELVMSMLTALKHNSSIVRFDYWAAEGWPVNKAHFGTYETQLLEVLQHNITLSRVDLCRTELTGKVKYLLDLNDHGRRRARDPMTTVTDFVAQLSTSLEKTLPTQSDEDEWERKHRYTLYGEFERKRKNNNALGICYGLLRESPDLWCTHALHQPSPLKRRRLF